MYQQANNQQASLNFSFRSGIYPNPKYSNVKKTIKSRLEIAAVKSKAPGTLLCNKGAEHQQNTMIFCN